MDNFDLTKFLAEGKLHEAMFDVATTEKIAQAVADAFTAEDNELDLKYIVNPDISERSFDLDVEAGPNTPGEDSLGQDIENYLGDYAGGSFYIKDGVVYNAAMRNAPVANVTPEGEVEMISAEDSRAALGMVDGEKTDYMERRREMSDYMEEGEMLNEGIIDTIKDKLMSVGKKLLSKFSPEEQVSMKAAAEKVLGPNYSKEDITLDKAKEIGKIISGGLDESQELDENLRKKIGATLLGLGLPTAFVAGHGFGHTDAGAITAGIGAVAAMIGMVMTLVDEGQEVKEIKSNKMKKSELKEMIKAAMSENARTDAEEEGYLDGMRDEKEDMKEAEDVEVEDNENVDVDIEKDLDVKVDDEESEVDIDVKASMPGESEDVEEVQALLMKAQEAAEALGDDKLQDQIGNTITYFTRAHVAGNVSEADLDMDLDSAAGRAKEATIGLDEKKQGYNDELDDSEGAKHGKKKQDMAQRRADSENMEKADGKRKYSGDKSKDLNESVVFPMWNKIK
jgi:hypothetical protein